MTNKVKKASDQLREVASDFDAVSQEMFNLSHRMEAPRFNPENELYSLVRSAESGTLKLRSVAARFMGSRVSTPEEYGETQLCVQIKEMHHWLKITVPSILPGRNVRDNTLFITRPLRNCLVQFQRTTPIERFRDCVICIVHQYDEALGIRRVRDYDNVETKRYLDVIESVFLTNDCGLLCTVLQTTQMSDRDCTDFYIMLPEALPNWCERHLNRHTEI